MVMVAVTVVVDPLDQQQVESPEIVKPTLCNIDSAVNC